MLSREESLKKSGCYNNNHEKVSASVFETTPFFDKKDIVQVKYEMIRAASKNESSITEIADLYGFSRKSYYKINEAYREDGFYALLPKKTGPKGSHKVNAEAQKFIEQYVLENKAAKNEEIADALEKKTGIHVHPRTIYRHLKKN